MEQSSERREPRYAIASVAFTAARIDPGLHVVATPIGHLGDITIRALETLAGADMVLCEDTRVTRVLFDRYAIRNHLSAYHEHNAEMMRPRIMDALAEGKSVALVSDAGTPLVSDPGYKLVTEAIAHGHKVIAAPGASAVLTALVSAGLPSDRFLFVGFLPSRSEARRQRIEALKPVDATLIIYEAPHRTAETLAELAEILGADRPAALCRELTKKFEECRRGGLKALAEGAEAVPPRGEVVLVIGPPQEEATGAGDVDALLLAALAHQPVGKAAAEVARLTGQDRKALYRRALELKGG
ncbi:MAG: 16S rRNA (cytidine(1402)-2'-O)-methyltransferase [Hyphomicrobiaceae bacterium]|nr:16S rRNA (cytidine(1402)-2'-O)-methyltransferase [Hyphomicrobiaceae bacterium]